MKGKKRILKQHQTVQNHYVRIIRRGRRYQDKLNDVAEQWFRQLESAIHTIWRSRSGWRVEHTCQQLFCFFLFYQITILPSESNKYYQKTFIKLPRSPWSHAMRILFSRTVGSSYCSLKSKKQKKSLNHN